jgi:NUBPL iron-transfer P-loop NTPase
MDGSDLYAPRPPDTEINLISVQSVKGGVGKTLLSMLLADHIRRTERGRVVVLDLDFTGTSVADQIAKPSQAATPGAKSPREPEQLNGINVKVVRAAAGAPITLLDLFEGRLQGRGAAESFNPDSLRVAGADSDSQVFHLASGKTYETRPDRHFANVLFDQNHALWFVDFLFDLFVDLEARLRDGQVSADLSKKQRELAEKPLYVILDNGPGQSELLTLLQQRMLRWGRHRAKFIQVASLDEMDLLASLTALSTLDQQARLVRKTKETIALDLRGDRFDPVGWGHLLPLLEGDQVDRDLVEEILTGDRSTVAALIANGDQEGPAEKYLTLVVNRVFRDAINLGLVDDLIVNQVAAPAAGKPTRKFLNDLRRVSFRFDPALALFFQERFLQRGASNTGEPADSTQTTPITTPASTNTGTNRDTPLAAHPESARSESTATSAAPPLGDPVEAPASWEQLAELDLEVYRELYWPATKPGGVDFLTQSLLRGIALGDASHLMRGLDLMGRVLDLSHRIVRECWPGGSAVSAGGDTFRVETRRALGELLETLKEPTTSERDLRQRLATIDFVSSVLRPRLRRSGEQPPLVKATYDSFIAAVSPCQSGSKPNLVLVCEMLRLAFPIYGGFIAFPTLLNPAPGNDPAAGKVLDNYVPFVRAIYTVAYTVITAALAELPTPDLCSNLANDLGQEPWASPQERTAQVHRFHLELADVMESAWLFARSLDDAAQASRLLLALAKELPRNERLPAPSAFRAVHPHRPGRTVPGSPLGPRHGRA